MMMYGPMIARRRGSEAGPITSAYQGFYSSASDLTTYMFSGCALGAAAGNRRILVGEFHQGPGVDRTVSALTVAGVSATMLAAQAQTTDKNYCSIWSAAVPAGATGDIVLSLSGGAYNAAVSVVAVYGAAASAHDTANSLAHPLALGVDVVEGGFAMAVCRGINNNTVAWSGLTERHDSVIETLCHSTACDDQAAAATPLSITATLSGAIRPSGCAVSLAPG